MGKGENKAIKAAGRPRDDGPPLTLREIQLAPVIWAKLSGYSWWPARVATIHEVKGIKRPQGKDMICTYFLGDNNIGFVKLSNVLRFTRENCEQYGSRITTKSFKDGVAAAIALLNESETWDKEFQARALDAATANGNAGADKNLAAVGAGVLHPVPGIPFLEDGACEMCGDNNEAKGDILLCDSCDAEYHLSCCTPPLKVCPEGEWFCLTCRKNRGEPVTKLFNEERAKKEATMKQHELLNKPPLPNKAGKKKRDACESPVTTKPNPKKAKSSSTSSPSAAAAAAAAAPAPGSASPTLSDAASAGSLIDVTGDGSPSCSPSRNGGPTPSTFTA
ncbi:unnamed protein product, partial [Ectocarpus sp. 12 AP-2014]